MDENGSGYELGSGEAELARLELQGTAPGPGEAHQRSASENANCRP